MTSRAPDRGGFPSEDRLRRWVDALASDAEGRARAAFASLDRACRRPLLAAARPIAGDTMEAEDVVQDLLAQVWMSRERLEIEGKIRTYLLASIRYECLRVIRWYEQMEEWWEEPGEGGTGVDGGGPSGLLGPEETVYTLELVEWFERALAKLSDGRCQAIRLKWRGLSNAEVAAFLGIFGQRGERPKKERAYATVSRPDILFPLNSAFVPITHVGASLLVGLRGHAG